MREIRPQQGFQIQALSTPADIAILGGAAGVGKTFIELLEPIRHKNNKNFDAIIFRRNTTQIRIAGGLWATSMQIYPYLRPQPVPVESKLKWNFPSGATIAFNHIEYESTLQSYQGSAFAYIGFDELTHFTQSMFTYFFSRNRGMSGVRGYIRATCNPDPDSWVAEFLEWWIDQETGFPIHERAGKIRYMTCYNNVFIWGDTKQEVIDKCPEMFSDPELLASGIPLETHIKSVTFIPGVIYDNKILLKMDPGYLGNLLALPEAEKQMLLYGNWKVRTDGLGLFEYDAIKNIFTNYPEENANARRCITVDAARFGRDFCVIYVWKGWEVIHISVFKTSDVHDIVRHIEELRRKFQIVKTDVIVDQDGVGGGTVTLGQYRGFHGGGPARKDPSVKVGSKPENYFNLKTQCYYRTSKRVNEGKVRINVTSESCLIFDDSSLKGIYSTTIKVGSKVKDIRDLICSP